MDSSTVILEQNKVYHDSMSSLYNSHGPKVMGTFAPSDTHLVVRMSLTSWNRLLASNMSGVLESAKMEASWMAIIK